MSELDPLTNLPKDPPSREKISKALKNSQARELLRGSVGTLVPGTFGEYDADQMIVPGKNFNELRARSQSFPELFAKSVAQSATTIAGMTIESVGFLGDIPNAVQSWVTGSEQDFERNFLTQAGKDIQDWGREAAPIYQTEEAQGKGLNRFFDATFWASNAPSISSTVALMIPSGAIGMSASRLARLALSKGGQRAVATIGSALSSRHMENMMESTQSYETIYQKALAETQDPEYAKRIASEEAALSYRRGYTNIVTDLLGWGALTRKFDFANRATKETIQDLATKTGDDLLTTVSAVMKRNPGLTAKGAVEKAGYKWADFVGQAGLEGAEEFNQTFIARLAEYNSDVALGLKDANALSYTEALNSEVMDAQLEDPEAWNATVLGFLGGAVFQGLGQAYGNYQNKKVSLENADVLKAEVQKMEEAKRLVGEMNKALVAGDTVKAEQIRDDMIFKLAISGMNTDEVNFGGAAIEGKLETTIELFEGIKNMSPEERQAFQFDEETSKQADYVINELKEIGETLNDYYNSTNVSPKLDTPLSILKTEHSYRAKKLEKRISDIEQNITKEETEGTFGEISKGLTEEQSTLLRNTLEFKALTKTLEALESGAKELLNADNLGFRVVMAKKGINKAVPELKNRIRSLAESIHVATQLSGKKNPFIGEYEVEGEVSSDLVTVSGKELNEVKEFLGQFEDSDLFNSYVDKSTREVELITAQEGLAELHKPSMHTSILEDMSKTQEDLKQAILEKNIKDSFSDADLMMYTPEGGETVFGRIYTEGDTIEFEETDRLGNTIADSVKLDTSDKLLKVSEGFKVDLDKIMSPQEWAERKEQFEQHKKEGNWDRAGAMLTDVMYKSNYSDNVLSMAEETVKSFKEDLDTTAEYDEVLNKTKGFLKTAPKRYKPEIIRIAEERISEIAEAVEKEQKAIEQAIEAKKEVLKSLETKIENAQTRAIDFVESQESTIDKLYEELKDKGITKIDGRTKPARRLKKLRSEIESAYEQFEAYEKAIRKEQSLLQKDMQQLSKLRETLSNVETVQPEVGRKLTAINAKIKKLKADVLLRSDLSFAELTTLENNYAKIFDQVEKAIRGIEAFKSRIETLDNSGDILKEVADSAYEALALEGVVSESMSVFSDLSEEVFNRYVYLFNKKLTETIKNKKVSKDVRKVLNENRLTSKNKDVNYWASLNTDFPHSSILSIPLYELDDVMSTIRSLQTLRREADTYQLFLDKYNDVLTNEVYAVPGVELKNPTEYKDQKDVIFSPQRNLNSAFSRAVGNSGDNQDPNSDPSQRAYFRFVNNTDFEGKGYQIQVTRPTNSMDIPEEYDRNNVLVARITNAKGEYLTPKGTTTSVFNPSNNLWTTLPEATYEIPGSEYSRVHEPSEKELRNYAGNTTQERKANYEALKEKLRVAYEAKRQEWFKAIDNKESVYLPIIGKSKGIEVQGAEPVNLEEVFDTDTLEFKVATEQGITWKGQELGVPSGFVAIIDTEKGNIHKGHRRTLKKQEQNAVIEAFRSYVENSTLEESNGKQVLNKDKDGKLNEKAQAIYDKEGNKLSKGAFQIVRSLLYSLESGKGPIRLSGTNLIIKNTSYSMFGKNANGELMPTLNSDLEAALRSYMEEAPIQVESAPVNRNKDGTYTRITYTKKDGFISTPYPSYKEYLLKENVVQTYIDSDPTFPDGSEGYRLLNQNIEYDLNLPIEIPSTSIEQKVDTSPQPKKPSSESLKSHVEGESISSLNDIKGRLESLEFTYKGEFYNALHMPDGTMVALDGPALFMKMEDPASFIEGVLLAEVVQKIKIGPKPVLADEVESSTEEVQPQEKPDEELDDDFISGGVDLNLQYFYKEERALSQPEFTKISTALTKATGIPVEVLSSEEALTFFNKISTDEQFTIENLPHGGYYQGVAYVVKDGPIQAETLFHEVAHPIINQLMSQNPDLAVKLYNDIVESEEGKEVYREVEKAYGAIFDKDGYIISNNFAELLTTVLGRSATKSFKDKTLVQKIIDEIKKFFKELFGSSVRVEELSETTTMADLAEMLVTGTSIQLTPNLISAKDIQFSKKTVFESDGGQSVKFTNDTMDLMNFLFFDTLFKDHADKLNILFSSEDSSEYYKEVMESISSKLQVVYTAMDNKKSKGAQSEKFEQAFQNLEYILENWDETLDLHKTSLSKYNVAVIDANTVKEDAANLEKDSNAYFQDSSIQFSAKQTATSIVRFMIGSLVSSKRNDSFPQFATNVDFGKTFNILANHLAGTTNIEQKKKIVNTLASVDGMKYLLQRVLNKGASMSKAELSTVLQFNEAFSKNNNKYLIGLTNEGLKFQDATVNTSQSKIKQKWYSESTRNKNLYVPEGNKLVYNTEYINELYPSKALKDIKLNKKYRDLSTGKSKFTKQYYKALQFLDTLGITITAYDVPSQEIVDAAEHVLTLVKEGKGTNIFTSEGDMTQYMSTFVAYQQKNAVDDVENQHYSVKGETVYNVTLNHYVSLINNSINGSATLAELFEKEPHLNTSYNQDSILLHSDRSGANPKIFFDKKGKKVNNLDIFIFEGISNSENAEEFSKLDHSDKVRIHFEAALEGMYPLFRAGDKKLERFLNTGEFFTEDQINTNFYTDLFYKYLLTEIDYIKNNEKLLSTIKGGDALVANPIENSILMKMVSTSDIVKQELERILEGQEPSDKFQVLAKQEFVKFFDNQLDDTLTYFEDLMLALEKDGEYTLTLFTDTNTYTKQEIKALIKRVIVNTTVSNIEQTKLLSGHPAFYGKANNFFHRMSGALGTKKISTTGDLENRAIEAQYASSMRLYAEKVEGSWETFDEYESKREPIIRTAVHKDPEVKSSVYGYLKEILEDKAEDFKDMEESDAIGLIHLDVYRDMKVRAGEWTEALDRLYHWELRPKGATSIEVPNWTTGELYTVREKDLINNDGKRTVFNMLKPQYFGPMVEDEFIPGMYKTSLLPVLPSYSTDAFKQLNAYMSDNKVGIVTFETANKVGTKNPGQPLYNEQGTPELTATTQDTFFRYWGLQLQTGNSVKDSVILGSQFMKQIFNGIYDRGIANELGPVAEEMSKIHNRLVQDGLDSFKSELGLTEVDGEYIVDAKKIEKLKNFLIEQSEKRDANHNIIQGLDSLEEILDYGLGLDALSNRDKIEQILASIADSRVISQKVHGGAKIQASSTFFEENPREGKELLSNELEFYSKENGYMEVYLPHYFKELTKDFTTEEVEGYANMLLEGVGFRIPTSGLNVIERIKIKGFLPQSAGETIVLPTEIVAKAGSDFDVDKLNILLPNYGVFQDKPNYIEYIDSVDKAIEIVKGSLVVTNEKGIEEKATTSKVISTLKKKGYPKLAGLVKKNSKNVREALKKLEDIESLNTSKATQNRFLELAKEIISAKSNRKALLTPIGIDTLVGAKEELDTITGQTYPNDYATMIGNYKNSTTITQRNIESIAGTGISALHVSDHVHSTRYNYYVQSADEETGEGVNISMPVNRTEDGDISLGHLTDSTEEGDIGDILNQITNMFIDGVKNPLSFSLNLNLQTAPTALFLIRAGMPIREVIFLLNQPAVKMYTKLQGIQSSTANDVQGFLSKEKINSLLESKFGTEEAVPSFDPDFMKSQIANPTQKIQNGYLNEFIEAEKAGQLLNMYVNATRVDTAAMGKNTSQLELYLRDLINIEQGNTSIRNSSRLLRSSEDKRGFLQPHYDALKEFKRMFSPLFHHYINPQEANLYEDMITYVSKKKASVDDKVRLLDKFKSDMITYKLLTTSTSINNGTPTVISKEVDRLFKGPNSVAKQLLEYSKRTDNVLINSLVPYISTEPINGEHFDGIKLIDQRLDVAEQNTLIESWRNLFDESPQLASDLVKVALLQSGMQMSPISFTKYIPQEIYTGMLLGISGEKINPTKFLQQFILNNADDKLLVPTVWGNQTPSSPVFKRLEREAKEGEVKKGFRKYKPTFKVFIQNKGFAVGDTPVFPPAPKGSRLRNIKPVSFKDFRNGRSLQLYTNDGFVIEEESSEIIESEALSSLQQTPPTSPKDLHNKEIQCKPGKKL